MVRVKGAGGGMWLMVQCLPQGHELVLQSQLCHSQSVSF